MEFSVCLSSFLCWRYLETISCCSRSISFRFSTFSTYQKRVGVYNQQSAALDSGWTSWKGRTLPPYKLSIIFCRFLRSPLLLSFRFLCGTATLCSWYPASVLKTKSWIPTKPQTLNPKPWTLNSKPLPHCMEGQIPPHHPRTAWSWWHSGPFAKLNQCLQANVQGSTVPVSAGQCAGQYRTSVCRRASFRSCLSCLISALETDVCCVRNSVANLSSVSCRCRCRPYFCFFSRVSSYK